MRIAAIVLACLLTSACSGLPTQSIFETVGGDQSGINIGAITDIQIAKMQAETHLANTLTTMAASGCATQNLFGEDKARVMTPDALHAQAASKMGALSQDPVVNEVLNSAIRSIARTRFNVDISQCESVAPQILSYGDFVKFTNTLSGLDIDGSPSGMQVSAFSASNGPALSGYLIVYLNNYYQGKFVDRFETAIDKPDLSKGINDTAISNFARVILEAAFDAALNAAGGGQIYVDNTSAPTKYFPAETAKEPTAALDSKKAHFVPLEAIVQPGENGVTESEAKFTQFLANHASEEAGVLSSGFIKTLKNVHAGFIVAGTFAVGDNDTVADVATAAFEVIASRSVEAGSYALFEKIDGDSLPLAQLITVLGK